MVFVPHTIVPGASHSLSNRVTTRHSPSGTLKATTGTVPARLPKILYKDRFPPQFQTNSSFSPSSHPPPTSLTTSFFHQPPSLSIYIISTSLLSNIFHQHPSPTFCIKTLYQDPPLPKGGNTKTHFQHLLLHYIYTYHSFIHTTAPHLVHLHQHGRYI